MNAKQNTFFISIAYLLYALVFLNYLLITAVGMSFSLFIFLTFLNKIGKELPLKEMIVLIAAAQWIVGAKIGYNIGKVHYKYYMYVDEETYMSFVIPGLILFYIGLYVLRNSLQLSEIEKLLESNRVETIRTAKNILILGLASFLISSLIRIPQISFVFYLANLLIYVAAGHYMLLYPKFRFQIFIGSIFFMLVLSLQSGFFHDLIILATFLTFLLFDKRSGYFLKLVVISLGFASLYIIQIVKAEYRSIIWEAKGDVGVFSAFYNVLEEEFAPKPTYITTNLNDDEAEEQANINTRLNQGWIISKIMDNVPKNHDYFGGTTITEGIKSAILPRFLFPNKKGAEQALINFREISGIDLNKGTSMGLSVIGEFYANYGVTGAWVAMFLYGLFLSLIVKFLVHGLAGGSPLILLWFILFFFQVVKAETDFIKVINHLFKSIVFFMLLRFILRLVNFELLPKPKVHAAS